MATQPKFLMIPTLYEESTATVSWENTSDGEHYDLDISFNENFDTASHGKTWNDLETAAWSWAGQENASAHTWSELKTLSAQGLMWSNLKFFDQSWEQQETENSVSWQGIQEHSPLFTVFHGSGEDIAAPDQGLTWGDLDSAACDWTKPDEEEGSSWKKLELAPSVGLFWWQHDQNRYSWSVLEGSYESWIAFQFQPPRGLCWGSLNAKWLTWGAIETGGSAGNGTSWIQLECLPPDNETHKGTVVDIPLYTKSSMMRVRAFDAEEAASPYLTSSLLEHRPRSLKKYTLPCLHFPQELREGRTAQVVWGDLYGASGYVLERKFDGAYAPCFDSEGAPASHPSDCTKPKDLYYGPDCKRHLACADRLPYYQKQVQYRIRGYNTTDSSQYLESPVIPIVPVFYRDDSRTVAATAGTCYLLPICSANIQNFEDIVMNISYSPDSFLVDEVVHPASGTISTVLLEQSAGTLRFRCAMKPLDNMAWSGFLLAVRFQAIRSGNTTITLS